MLMFFSKSSKRNFFFTGTYKECVEELRKKGFWESEEDYKNHLKNQDIYIKSLFFDEYSADFSKHLICIGTGVAYVGGRGPIYPDKTIFELNSEGFTQEEINHAFSKALQELKKMREKNQTEGYKDFLLKKVTD